MTSGIYISNSSIDNVLLKFVCSYIVDCLDAGYKLPLRGFYYLSIGAATRKLMAGSIDPFGDRYVLEILFKIYIN